MDNAQNMNQSSEKLLSILEVLANVGQPMRLQDIAAELGYNVSTVLRFLTTLKRHDYVMQIEGTAEYVLTYKICRLANQFRASNNPYQYAHSYLQSVSQSFNETASLAVEQNREVVYVDVVRPRERMMQQLQRIGNIAPLYCTGIGKLFLLSRTDEELRDYVEQCDMHPFTKNTLITFEQLSQELRKVREQGFAIDDEECEIGVRCVAVPLYDYKGEIAAGISVTGPSQRMRDSIIMAKLPILFNAASIISAYLGSASNPQREAN